VIRRTIRAVVAVLALASPLLTLPASAAPTAPAPPAQSAAVQGPYVIDFLHSGKCLDLPNSTTSNVQLIQYTCNTSFPANQGWYFEDTTSGYYKIRSQATSKCVTVLNASTANSAQVIQYPCNDTYNAQWLPVPKGTSTTGLDYYELRNRNSGKCLNVQGASTSNSAKLIQYDCASANDRQTWF
jgi:hypothetical protein